MTTELSDDWIRQFCCHLSPVIHDAYGRILQFMFLSTSNNLRILNCTVISASSSNPAVLVFVVSSRDNFLSVNALCYLLLNCNVYISSFESLFIVRIFNRESVW